MKIIIKPIILILFIVIFSNLVIAYDLDYDPSFNKDFAELFLLSATHNIQENRDMNSNIYAIFDIYPDYFNIFTKYRNFSIRLYPNDYGLGQPPLNISVNICSIEEGNWYTCNETYKFTLNKTLLKNWVYINEETGRIDTSNYYWYTITFVPKPTKQFHNYYFINLSYTIPKLVTKQHENYVAQFNINIPETKIPPPSNIVLLPSQEDIPIFFPNSIAPIKAYFNSSFKWAFQFKDAGIKQIWYTIA